MLLNHLLNASIGIIGGADGPTSIYLSQGAADRMENINQAARMMGSGMLGIFVVIGLIGVIVALLGKMGNRRD